jgi:hypothetical protein
LYGEIDILFELFAKHVLLWTDMNQNYILLTTRILDLRIVFRRNRWDSLEYVTLKRAVREDSGTSRLCVHLTHGVLRMHNVTVGFWKEEKYCEVVAVTVA